jgi:hypothetical protein
MQRLSIISVEMKETSRFGTKKSAVARPDFVHYAQMAAQMPEQHPEEKVPSIYHI